MHNVAEKQISHIPAVNHACHLVPGVIRSPQIRTISASQIKTRPNMGHDPMFELPSQKLTDHLKSSCYFVFSDRKKSQSGDEKRVRTPASTWEIGEWVSEWQRSQLGWSSCTIMCGYHIIFPLLVPAWGDMRQISNINKVSSKFFLRIDCNEVL